MSEATAENSLNDIAIIGMACRFAGASTPDEYWQRIQEGGELLTTFSRDELRQAGTSEELLDDPSFMPVTSLIDGYGDFEPEFFGITPSEARLMDPQHRLFLELCWQSLEDAGYDPARYDGDIGVFAGAGRQAYLRYLEPHFEQRDFLDGSIQGLQADIGNYGDFLATRVAYKLGLRGPALDVQTACSTALVSTHLACQSLLMGEADMALAGAVNLHTPQVGGYVYEEGSICSADGHLRPFDAKADGSVFGNGGGVVVLRRLDDAIAAGDRIVAVIKGSAINNDGSSKMSFTAPSVQGQAEVVARAQKVAGVGADQIGYVEAHGTGTPLGDPIEVAALVSAFDNSPENPYCALGTVKSQIGHLGPAAGVAGLIKAALAISNGRIPGCVNHDTLNPAIELASSPFYIPTTDSEWTGKRYAGVSAFGVGGTNAHAVLGEAPDLDRPVAAPTPHAVPLLLSARTPKALEEYKDLLARRLASAPDLPVGDVAYVLARGRSQHQVRLAVTASGTAADAAAALDGVKGTYRTAPESNIPLAFAFPGQGGQYVDVGRALYENDVRYRQAVDQCADVFADLTGKDLRAVIMPPAAERSRAVMQIRQAIWAQPAIFTTEYALARSLMAVGLRPEVLIGHSVGEYAAACLAGVFSLRDAMTMVAARGRLMSEGTAPGSMMAVNLPVDALRDRLPVDLDIAAVNAPDQTVVSGTMEAIARFDDELSGTDLLHTVLDTATAAHSSMMQPIVDEFRSVVETVSFSEPTLPIASTLTGEMADAALMTDPEYWVRHLRQAVLFAPAAAAVVSAGPVFVVETGPGRALAGMFRQAVGGAGTQAISPWVPKEVEPQSLADIAADVWSRGGRVDWDEHLAGMHHQLVSLPGYPFERAAHWTTPPDASSSTRNVASLGIAPKARPGLLKAPQWQQTPIETVATGQSRRVLVLVGHSPGAVEEALVGDGHEVVTASHLDLRNDEAEQLLDRLQLGDSSFDCVVYVADPPADTTATDRVRQRMADGFWPLLAVGSALARRRRPAPVDLVVVTCGRYLLADDTDSDPASALLTGPARVLPQEYPNVRVTEVDMELSPSAPALGARLARELRALQQHPAAEPIAYRGDDRYSLRYRALPVETGTRPVWARNGTYLITGGLGGIGLALAEDAARTPGVTVVLTHRSPLPDPGEAERLVADPTTPAPLRHRLEALRRLRDAGADVACVMADVADRDAMRAVRQEHGPFHGIVHAAGVASGRLIERLDTDHVDEVLAPKILGALVLDSEVADENTQWTAYCSSLSAVVGGVGHADYCSANAFLDAYADWRVSAGKPTTSLAYDAWTDAGMAVNEATRSINARGVAFTHPILDARIDSDRGALYTGRLRRGRDWVVDEHLVSGRSVLPGTAIIDLLVAAVADWTGHARDIRIDGLDLAQPVTVPDDADLELQVTVSPDGDVVEVELASRVAGQPWALHATCAAHPVGADSAEVEPIAAPGGPAMSSLSSTVITLGPRWDNIVATELTGPDELIVECSLPHAARDDAASGFYVHPALLDTAAGALIARQSDTAYLPMSYESIIVHRPMPERVRSRIRKTVAPDGTLAFDVSVRDVEGNRVVDLIGYTLRPAAAVTLDRVPSPSAVAGASQPSTNRNLVCAESGDLTSLTLAPAQRPRPGSDHVEIRVRATGLNFKEVLIGSGLLDAPRDDYEYGLECAGIVSAVGDGVTGLAVGDPVMAMGGGCFADYVLAPAAFTCRIPDGLTYTQAASLPVAYTTAHDCLVNSAALKSGERVLVHAITGGVGLAALRLAQHLGAEVFGTAGSDTKRMFATSAGVSRVMDSRSLDFEQETIEAGGVDVVLNSLAGAFIPAGMATLRDRGRFVEIGRRDILSGTALDMSLFTSGRSFTSYNPAYESLALQAAFASVADLVRSGVATPLPVKAFDLDQVSQAFEFMARAEHIGKVVVRRDGADDMVTTTGGEDPALGGLTSDVGVKALHDALATHKSSLLVTRRDLGAKSDDMFVAEHVLLTSDTSSRASRPELGYGFIPLETETERRVASIWTSVLSIEEVGRDDTFLDLGGDSLYATQVVARIRKQFGARIAPSNVLGDTKLQALSETIDAQTQESSQP